jgi:sulfite reductase beta subunit-like hemoprotein
MNSIQSSKSVVSIGDYDEYRSALDNFSSGRWSEDRWKTFRLRFGVYAQKQAKSYMIRAKTPGGRFSFSQARTAAKVNRQYCGSDIHITTRQDLQFYFIKLESTPAFLQALYSGGITTREASGNTFRNVVACPLAGICPHELVDASKVAESISTTWIRHPLVQHMPRKFKTTVSGCAHDCGASAIDDLGFVATTRDGLPGFKVVAGGGLGNRPHTAIVVEEFVTAADLAAVQEAFARMHHGHSNRADRNSSRIKFLVDKFGEEGFVDLFREHFTEIQNLSQHETSKVAWRTPSLNGTPPSLKDGVIVQHDGCVAVVIRPPLGMLDSDSLESLTGIAEKLDAEEFRLTRDQNIMAIGLPEHNQEEFIAKVGEIGFKAGTKADIISSVVSCPGTSTCPIGITNSNSLAHEIAEDSEGFSYFPESRIGISGCHNSCGQHHIADFGLHALAKKIKGKSAPHYQFHVGGDGTHAQRIAIVGPVVPARLAHQALKTLIGEFSSSHRKDESVRDWALRIGKPGLKEILKDYSAEGYDDQDQSLFLDVGSEAKFYPPETATGECAAPAVIGEYLANLAETSLLDISRRQAIGDDAGAIKAAHDAVTFAIKRLLLIVEVDHKNLEHFALLDVFFEKFSGNPHVVSSLNSVNLVLSQLDETSVPDSLEADVSTWITVAENFSETLISGAEISTVSA